MSKAFDAAVEIVLVQEGVFDDESDGFSNDPTDRGGLTRFGIAQNRHPEVDVSSLTRDQAIDIYRKQYWDINRCDELRWPYGLPVFDCGVNQGTRVAARLLQRALGITDDGIIGPKTIWAAKVSLPSYILPDFMARRIKRYSENTQWPTYGRGWAERTFIIHREALTPYA